MAHGDDRLACLCGTEECAAAQNPPSTGVIVYLVAHEDTLTEPPTPAAGAHTPRAHRIPTARRARRRTTRTVDEPTATTPPTVRRRPTARRAPVTPTTPTTPSDPDGCRGHRAATNRRGHRSRPSPPRTPHPDRRVDLPAAEYAGLDGLAPPMFSQAPARDDLAETSPHPDHRAHQPASAPAP